MKYDDEYIKQNYMMLFIKFEVCAHLVQIIIYNKSPSGKKKRKSTCIYTTKSLA